MRWNRLLLLIVTATLAAVVLFFFGSVAFDELAPPPTPVVAETPPPQKQESPLVTFVDPSKGPIDAKHTVVVFSEYACPFCKEFNTVIGRLFDDLDGGFRLVWKNIPNPHYPGADRAAAAALCANEQGRYWPYHERLFETSLDSDIELALAANDLGLDETAFTRCLAGDETKALVERTVTEAVALDIKETPTVFIDGKLYTERLSYELLGEALRK